MEMKETSFKLLIDNALLEQEKRISSEFRQEIIKQTDRFTSVVDKNNGSMLKISQDIGVLQAKYDGLKTRIWTVGAVSASLSGFLVFLISRLI